MGTHAPEVEDVLSIINHPPSRLPGPNLLHLLVQSSSRHGQPAIDFLGPDGTSRSTSYAELHHASEALATRISASVGTQQALEPLVVPVLIPQSPELYIALLAILKAGGAFCPMNLDLPPERAKFILEDVSATVVITTSGLRSRLPPGNRSVLVVDDEAPAKAVPVVSAQHRLPTPSDLAYVMYTSGSTGTPKGVGVSHEAATQSLLAHDRHIPQFSRFLQFAAPTFDVSVFDIFFPLFRGRTLVGCTRSAMLNDLPAVIRRMDVDACELTPSVAGSLLRKRENAPGLRLLLTIGEMLTEPVVHEFGGSADRPSMLWGMYGPTEAAIHCTLQPAFTNSSAVQNIGIPLDTVSAFVLEALPDDKANSEFRVLPRGQVGELAVGGHQLAVGYLNRPEQTKSAFIDTPYGRLYRTGDKARMRPDGTLECLGRIVDGQVKLRGQRLELGEVEHAALRTPGCHGAVAAVTNAVLVLFCAVEGSGDMAAAVGESCKQWLPGFMLPNDIVVVESFPRLASGKVDRKGLVAEYRVRLSEGPRGTSDVDELEQRLCRLASTSLGLTVHPSQDLARAGLDSLSAIKLASVLRDAGFQVNALDLLGARTISSLRSLVDSAQETRVARATPEDVNSWSLDISNIMANHPLLGAPDEPVECIIPCTRLQTSMLAETAADPRAYCNWVELAFPRSDTEKTIRTWFLQLAQANEILRTGFIHHQGQFLQVIFKSLSRSAISTADCVRREFEMQDDHDFLRPFRVQVSTTPNGEATSVVLQLHHAVYDGWSLDLLFKDLARLTRGDQLVPRAQFSKIAAYHQSSKFTESCDAAREFWAGTLLGFRPPALPVLVQAIPTTPALLSSSIILDISPHHLKTALQRTGINCGPQTVFQAALAWLWSSMVGTEDVVIGSVTSGRTMPISNVEDIVGPCIAAVPLRTDLSQARTIKDLLVTIHAATRAALPHSALPLSEIKQVAGVPSGQPIYDVLFVYQESLHGRDPTAHTFQEVAHQDYLETKLLVEVEPGDKDFECRFSYHSDVFPEAQVRLMANLIRTLVLHTVENLDAEISLMRKAFPSRLLSIFDPTPGSFSGVPDLAQAVEGIVARFPDKEAVCFANSISDNAISTTTITFAELSETADRIASHLHQAGLREGGVVGIIMEKSVRLYAGILAILKAGCAYLPLLPSTPVPRIETIVQQAKPAFCLVDTATRDKLWDRLPCNMLDIQSLSLGETAPSRARAQPDPDRLAYVIYTSGSTGVPKGVCVTQLNIMSNLDVLSHIYPVKEGSRLLQSCSQAFDVSVFEIFFAWTQGICLCSGTNDTLFEDLENSIRKLNVTHLSMTPTVASLVDPANVPQVEFLVTAGEAMTESVAGKWGDKLYQGYGPSETTNICSVKRMGPDQAIRHLGWSLDNTSTFVLAKDSTEVVPLGCVGEFCFGGDQIARGYLNMDDLTSAKFITHPAFGRIYRSGDLGRMLSDGSMVILGRADEQIKLRGQRVELGEVTEAVKGSSNAADCATLLLCEEDTGLQDRLVCFLVPNRRQTVTSQFRVLDVDDDLKLEIQSLYHALSTRLPSYMVPSAVVPISTLPTTSSGKLDRARLRHAFIDLDKHLLASISQGAEFHAGDGQLSDVEMRVAEAVTSALGVKMDDVQKWTPLATLGLDSISAIQVSRHLHARVGPRCPISLILQNPSVARLSQVLSHMDPLPRQGETPDLLPKHVVAKVIERLDQEGKPFTKILPCTALQEAMLAASAGMSGQYLNRMLFRINGDLARLKEAWTAMCARHGILRTCFLPTDDAQWPIIQGVLDKWHLPWHDFDASRSTIEDCISQHARLVPDALDSLEPAISLATIKHDDRVFLSFVCHHALYDGVAVERLLYEVEQHVSGSAALPPAPAYDDFLRASLRLPASTDGFWLQHLAGYEPILAGDLRFDHLQTGVSMPFRELDLPLTQVKSRIRDLGVSLLALTQSAWAICLEILLRASDVCFGNVVNGRSLPIEGLNELVAPCFNTIPIRMDLSASPRNVDLMKAFQTLNTKLLQYQYTPLRRTQRLIAQHGNRRLFDTLLLLQQSPRPPDQSLWTLERDEGEMDVPVVCEVTPDTQIDRLTFKIHTTERQRLPPGVVSLILDVFSFAMHSCLRFPASRVHVDDVPQGLAERLSQLELRPPNSGHTTVTSRPDGSSDEWTPSENSIRAVLASLSSSDAERIQRDTAIYQLGLDSIGAVQVAAMLRQLGHQVLAGDVMEHPTCRSLAQYIDNPAADAGGITVYDVSAFQTQVEAQVLAQGVASDSFEAIVPCTPVQAAVMAQFIKSDGRDYFNYVGFELQDRASATSVLDAWQAVCHAHPILRTGIIPVEHADCAFTMVQYSSHTFTPALAIQSLESGETFDPKGWLTEACRVAVREPERRLWSVAIVQAEEAVSMHLAIHHALYDAHSLQLILDDVSRAARGDGIPRSMPLANAAADILGRVFAAAESSAGFWKEQSDKVVINRFPVMTPLRQSSRDVLTESIQSGVPFTALQEATSTSGHTLQVVLQAAWTRVLSAYLGEDSVVFGVTLSGRTTEATQRAVFPCLTTLPVIATNRDSNHELLARMMQYNTELHKQQHQPLTRIQQWLGHADSRLFDTLMVYQKLDLDSTSESRPWRIVDEASNVDYPVSIEVQPEGGHLRYAITFFSDVLAKEQAVTLLRQFDATVRHLALKPTGHEADLFTSHPELFSILPPAVPEIPATVHLLHQFVELQALKTPDSTALRFVDGFDGDTPLGRMWTYKELDTNGNRVAQTLVSHVQPGDIVAVYFDKCPEAYFSILGILKAGCAFIALDRGAPKLRNQFILEDSGASVLLTSKRGRDDMELTISVPVIIISEESMQAAPAGRPVVSRNLDPDDVCYCLYTSGTTGTPKGCEITHENAVQCMFAFQHIFKGHWQEDSKWLQFASLHFDVSVLEQYWSWSVGITLVAAPRDLILEDLAGAISRLDITHIDLTPSLARLLHPRDVPSLCRGVFITGGESLKQEILDAWGPEGVIYNFYGPTEATIGVTVYPRVPTTGRPCNIGRQFVNVGSYLLRPGTERPVLRGGVGELCVSGRLVGKGYLKRDDLTRERFPTLERFGERVYRTGDLVRVLHDGCFDFLGRADDQVKLRGQRLEVGEINHAIRKGLEAVTDVATLVVRNEAQQKDLLVSFIVADDEGRKGEPGSCLEIVESPEALELCRRARDACRSRLPGYMVPTYVLRLPFIPLSANNKAETKELRRFFSSLSHEKLLSLSSVDRSRQALGRTGRTVSEVLSAMLAVDESSITPSSSIFELGVDSVSVLRLSRALKKAGLAQASPSLIMQHPLIADLSHALDSEAQQSSSCSVSVAAAKQLVQACAHKHRSHVCKELDTSPDQIEYIAPCSPLQQGMIARSGTDSAYFNTFRFVLAPEVSTERLRAAYQKTFDALPILRTKFVRTTDGFVQVAMKHVHLAWSGMRLRPKESVEEAVRKSRELWVARNQGCLVQPAEAVLIEPDDPGARLLVLHIFHGLYDANSFGLILDHVASQYRALAGDDPGRNTAFQLTSGPSFLDALCCGPLQDFSHSRPFWVAHLDGARFQSVRTPSPKDMEEFSPDNAVVVSRHHQVALGHLQPLRTRLGVTQQALVQAAWVSVLGKHFSANPTIGIIVSGRAIELHDAENVVGPLFNTLPFRACVSGRDGEAAASWSSLIRQCHDFNTAVLAFQHVPLRDIQKWCSAGKPLFDTLFSFQQDGGKVAEDGGLWTVVDSNLNADYPLALEAVLGLDGSLHLLLVAQQDWDDSGKLSRMMDELEEAFDDMVKNPDHSLRSQGSNEGVIRGTTPNGDTANGHIVGPEPTPATFVWTEEAVTIRNEMAALADMDPGSVTETAPVFGLGLDSIDVIKLSARLKRRGIEIKTGELMKAQTMEAMVKLLQSRRDSAEMDRAERGSRRKEISEATSVLRAYVAEQGEVADGDIVLPTTPLQESMLVEMMESDFQLYFNHDILELAPSVDIDKLKAAWRTVIMGTPILRTRFVPIDSPRFPFAYCQVIGREPQCSMTDVSIDTVEELARASNTARLRACEGAGRSDLLQLGFASIGKQRYLVLSIAHALYDGWSLKLLHRDVEAAYEGTYSPQSLESYLGQLEDLLFSETRDAPAFWSGFLQDATPTMLSEDAAGPDQQHALHRAELASSLVDSEIASFCRANAVTLQTLGQACWAALLASRTGSLDVSFGVVLSCRDTEALEGLLFPTMNTVAVRSVLHGTISSWLRYMQDNMASLSLYQHFPLREAKKLAGTNGPLFNTLFIHQPEMPWSRHRGGDDVMKSVGGSSAVEYPVCVEVEMSRSSLIWRAACNGRYASQAETGRLLQDLDRILAHIVNKPEAGVLLFSEQEVSICGLSPVRLATPEDKSPTPAMGDSQAEESEAWSPVEQTIREVLAEVSGVPATVILKSNTIYHLGLDSITAIKAGALLRKKGIEMRIRDMLKAGSISDMARLARETRGRPPVVQDGVACRNDPRGNLKFAVPREVDLSAMLDGLGFDKSAIKDVLSASPMQVHMLSVWQNTDGEVFYPTFTYTLSGQVGIDTIDAAWKALVAETPILRTVFVPTTSRSVPILQLVLDPSALGRTWASADSTMWNSRETGTLSQPYNSLSAEKDGQDRWVLWFKIHHALYDAVSLPAIMARFVAHCRGDRIQEPARLALGWRSATAFALLSSEETRAKRKHFWTEYLSGVDFPGIMNSGPRDIDARVSIVKPGALQAVSGLLELCRARGVSLQALFFAAYAELLASEAAERGDTRPHTVVFGIYLANRGEASEPGADVHPFLRLVPLRVVLQNRASLLDVAADIQGDIHAISSPVNVDVGLWEIKDWTGITLDAFLNFLGPPASHGTEGGVRLEQREELTAASLLAPTGSGNEGGDSRASLAPETLGNPVRDAFPDSIDIEVSVHDNDMTVGVFGPGTRLDDHGALRIIDGVAAILRRVSDQGCGTCV